MASVAYHPYDRPAKAPKDPNKPKKKKSAFDIFRSEQMNEFKRLNPDTKVDLGVFMTNLSATWASLSDERKVPYVSLADQDGKRFQLEMSTYVPAPQFNEPAKKKKRKRVKEPGEPKRATTAFMFFSNLNRAEVVKENPDFKIGQVAKVMGERWNAMDVEARQKYQEMADQDKIRYNEEIEVFRRTKVQNMQMQNLQMQQNVQMQNLQMGLLMGNGTHGHGM